MARRPSSPHTLQQELLRLLRPPHRRLQQQPSERIRPRLAEIGAGYAGCPAAEILPLLEEAVRSVSARPDMEALREFADEISRGENPFD